MTKDPQHEYVDEIINICNGRDDTKIIERLIDLLRPFATSKDAMPIFNVAELLYGMRERLLCQMELGQIAMERTDAP
jgi:hypothetical protein